jgi:hydrogenase expression/formation protein HypC
MKVISLQKGVGIAEISGVKKEISFLMLPEAKIGDYVIVHAGFAIQKLNENEAQKTLALFREMAGMEDSN